MSIEEASRWSIRGGDTVGNHGRSASSIKGGYLDDERVGVVVVVVVDGGRRRVEEC